MYKTCITCHGPKADKPGLNKGKAPSTLTQAEIAESLKGYKAGTRNAYGMGALMKGNLNPINEADLDTLAAYIKTLN
ncbi:MAG: c-type cytochrome [Helicobacteraceae bacterium]|nr:c-type cytochrome [Helicobacteraceae bacterium]